MGTAGLANDVDAVNQYAATMYAATASSVIAARVRPTAMTTPSNTKVATASLSSCAPPARAVIDQVTSGSSNIALVRTAPARSSAVSAASVGASEYSYLVFHQSQVGRAAAP